MGLLSNERKKKEYDNTVPKDVIKKRRKNTLISIGIFLAIALTFIFVLNPFKGDVLFLLTFMTAILVFVIIIPTFLGEKLHPNRVYFSKKGVYLKRKFGKEKFIPWRKVIKVTKDGKKLIYSSLILYGAGTSQNLFSEARLKAYNCWQKYKEYKENNPKYRLKEMKQDLKSRKKQVAAVFIALIVSILTNVWMYLNTPLYELVIAFVGGTVLLTIVLLLFLNKYRSLKADILEMKKKLKRQ